MKNKLLKFALVPVIAAAAAVGLFASKPAEASKPPVPAYSVCTTWQWNTGTTGDSRVKIVSSADFQTLTMSTTNNIPLNYFYTHDNSGVEYSLKDLKNNKLYDPGDTLYSAQACITDPGPAMAPFTSRYAFIEQQYKDFYGRSATPAEQQYWASTGFTQSQIMNTFVGQESTQRGQAVRLYKAYFLRLPDAGGYAYWVSQLKAGKSVSDVSSFFAGSDEFKARYGSLNNTQFVTLIYKNVLNRQPDQGGLNYWVTQLNAGRSRGWVMTNFSESKENIQNDTTSGKVGVYERMLRRPPTQTELNQRATSDANSVAAAILTTTEYKNRIKP